MQLPVHQQQSPLQQQHRDDAGGEVGVDAGEDACVDAGDVFWGCFLGTDRPSTAFCLLVLRWAVHVIKWSSTPCGHAFKIGRYQTHMYNTQPELNTEIVNTNLDDVSPSPLRV